MQLSALKYRRPSIVILLIIIQLFAISGETIAQQKITEFPNDPSLYLNSLENYFEIVPKSKTKEAAGFMQAFTQKWQSGFFSDQIKKHIYSTSNAMLVNKMSAIPHFTTYFNTLIHLIESKKEEESILAWMKAFQYLLNTSDYQSYTYFVRTSDILFTKNLVYSDRATKWKVDAKKFAIHFERDSLKYIFSNTNLTCYTKGDSTTINNTQGIYFPFSNTWKGEGGIVNWERANYPVDSVYAELKTYFIPLKDSKFTADSVSFYHLYYFEEAIIGKLDEQVMASRRGSKAIYPKFESYEKRWKIPNLFPGIDFSGGILIEGAKFTGYGDNSTLASLTILKNDTVFIKLRSENFSIFPNQIRSAYTSLSIYHANDSIYHSGLHMNYFKENKLLSFYRDDNGLTANPFYNTYHQISMYVEAVYWKMDENKISFDMARGRSEIPAHFESFDYFSMDRFDNLRGIDMENPLISLKRYSNNFSSTIVYFDEYAEFLRMPKEQVQLLLLKLAHQGFLVYDAVNQRAILNDRIDFYLKAQAGNIDSDVIRFDSRSQQNKANAYLQIDNFDLEINGLDRIILSNSQNLIIEPTNRKIVLEKNRHFSFDGKITAGRLSFASTQSTFDYNEFKLDMPSIDSMWFWVKGDQLPNGEYEQKNVQTAICNLSGNLLIDHPDNKSGLKQLKEYPIFHSEKDSYVYYDRQNIQNGVYTKENFYFHVNPFTFSSLNDFITDDIAFSGYLSSSDIFPDITQSLTVQEDYSLGFTKKLPPEGIMAYGNKGHFFNEVNLSNRGLKGSGKLTFLNSTTASTDFLFLPDSMNVIAQSFDLKPVIDPVEFPRIHGNNTCQHWMPYKETMRISTTDKPLSMYDSITSMKGTIMLHTTSLKGQGEIQFDVAKMTSNNYVFKNQTFDAQKTNFTDIGNTLNNYNAHTDYTKRTVTFVSNDGTSKVEFPENLYICYMDQATWYMDKEITDYASSKGGDLDQFSDFSLRQLADTEYEGSNFISTHPSQDSLSFFSTIAKFNSREKIIDAKGVHYIKVADAAIFPDKGNVTIYRNAEMPSFQNAKVIANAITKYHEIDQASIKILSRKSYTGSGNYVYIDRNQVRHPIHFSEIRVDSAYQTIARSEILPEANFALSPEFYFRGNVNLMASRKLLEFDGGFRIESKCIKELHWIKFSSVIDPENIYIPIAEQPIVPDIDRQQKFTGILYSDVQRKIYASFLTNKIDYYDPLQLTAQGFITYDELSKEFRISSKEKLKQPIRPDNYFSLNTTDCSNYGEGKVILDVQFPNIIMESYGNIQLKNSTANYRLGLALDFDFSEDALKYISNQFSSTSLNLADNNSPFYTKMIGGFLGIDEAENYLSQQLISNSRGIPERLQHTILLNDLKLKWNPRLEAYISEGNLGIESLEKNKINALVTGNLAIKKSRFGDELYIYFKIKDDWYFFKYAANVMQVLSSNENFNAIIQSEIDSKSKKNNLKKEDSKSNLSIYRYILSKTYVKDAFLNQLNIK